MKKMNKKGFTIVELVVVIAVIAILAAVMIPTFSGVTGKANDSARDQVAKAAHSAYLVYTDAQPGDFVIEVVDNNKSYFYAVDNGQFDPDADSYATKEAAAAATGDYNTATEVTADIADKPSTSKIYTLKKVANP